MTRQQQLLAQGQSVKPSKNDISSAQVTDTNFAFFESPATQPNPPFTIDDDSSDDSEKVQEEYVIAKEHEPDKERSDSFSETTHEVFSDVHSGTVEEGKDQIRQFWEEQRGTIGYYLSTLKVEERNAVVVSAENHTVQKVVCDHRYGKYSLYALTTGIVFEYDLKTGVVKDWFRSLLKYRTDHLNKTIDCVKRWPEVDPLRYADHIDRMKQILNCAVGSYSNTVCNQSALHDTVTEPTARAEAATRKQTTTAKVRGQSVNYELFDWWQVWPYLWQTEHIAIRLSK